jgi:hypothetical protein
MSSNLRDQSVSLDDMSPRRDQSVSLDDLSRRRMLGLAARGVAVAGAAVVAGAGTGLARAAQDDDAMLGSWLVAAVPPGAPSVPPARILVSVLRDGVVMRTAPLQQQAPPGLGTDRMFISTTHGVWSSMADGTIVMTFTGFAFDEARTFLATQRIRVAATVDESRNAFSGPFDVEFLATDGHVLASSSGTVQATRLEVEPPASA